MTAQDIAIDTDGQGMLDANIRRCGLFGLIPAAVRFLLFCICRATVKGFRIYR